MAYIFIPCPCDVFISTAEGSCTSANGFGRMAEEIRHSSWLLHWHGYHVLLCLSPTDFFFFDDLSSKQSQSNEKDS